MSINSEKVLRIHNQRYTLLPGDLQFLESKSDLEITTIPKLQNNLK